MMTRTMRDKIMLHAIIASLCTTYSATQRVWVVIITTGKESVSLTNFVNNFQF